MRKPSMVALIAFVVGAMFMVLSPAANAAPRAPLQNGLTSPISFTFAGTGLLFADGAVVEVDATYNCSPTIDSVLLPQSLGTYSVFSMQISEEIGHDGNFFVTDAYRYFNELDCNGVTQSFGFNVPTNENDYPLIPGTAVGFVVMRVCDLFGCSSASDVGIVTLSYGLNGTA